MPWCISCGLFYANLLLQIENENRVSILSKQKKAGRMKKTFAENNAAIKVYKQI